jgi:hypothetical protein
MVEVVDFFVNPLPFWRRSFYPGYDTPTGTLRTGSGLRVVMPAAPAERRSTIDDAKRRTGGISSSSNVI